MHIYYIGLCHAIEVTIHYYILYDMVLLFKIGSVNLNNIYSNLGGSNEENKLGTRRRNWYGGKNIS